MAEIKRNLGKFKEPNGDVTYTIDSGHTFGDVFRHVINEGATLADFKRVWREERDKGQRTIQ